MIYNKVIFCFSFVSCSPAICVLYMCYRFIIISVVLSSSLALRSVFLVCYFIHNCNYTQTIIIVLYRRGRRQFVSVVRTIDTRFRLFVMYFLPFSSSLTPKQLPKFLIPRYCIIFNLRSNNNKLVVGNPVAYVIIFVVGYVRCAGAARSS